MMSGPSQYIVMGVRDLGINIDVRSAHLVKVIIYQISLL